MTSRSPFLTRNSSRLGIAWIVPILALCSGPSDEAPGADAVSPQPAPGNPASSQAGTAAPTKRGLIIAIANYPRDSGYGRLNADNDVPLVRGALVSQGFSPDDITVLQDSAATRDAIMSALADLSASAGPGDDVVIHYSGHGHRLTDDDGDESDGFDEVLVPYGAPWVRTRANEYDGSGHLRDDDFGDAIMEIRRSVARQGFGADGTVLVLVDACFSGTATRAPGELPVRGIPEEIGDPQDGKQGTDEAFESISPATRGGGETVEGSTFVLISASGPDELDHERRKPDGTIVGPLSYAISETFPGAGGVTYRVLFDRIRRSMADVPRQTPRIEGDIDVELFSGRSVRQDPYFEVVEVEGENDLVEDVIIDQGRLGGILPGSRVAFHPRETTDTGSSDALAVGVVTVSHSGSAEVTLETPSNRDELLQAWAFVVERGLGERTVRMSVGPGLTGSARSWALDTLAALGGVTITDAAPDLALAVDEGTSRLLIYRTTAGQLFGAPERRGGLELSSATEWQVKRYVADAALNYARLEDFRDVALADERYRVEIEIEPIERFPGAYSPEKCRDANVMDLGGRRGGVLEMANDQDFRILIHNRGDRPAYVSVLEFFASGELDPLIPFENEAVEQISPGGTLMDCHYVDPEDDSPGQRWLKVFAMKDPVNFGPIVQARGPTRGGPPPSSLEVLMAESFSTMRNRRESVDAEGFTTEVMFNVPEENR